MDLLFIIIPALFLLPCLAVFFWVCRFCRIHNLKGWKLAVMYAVGGPFLFLPVVNLILAPWVIGVMIHDPEGVIEEAKIWKKIYG